MSLNSARPDLASPIVAVGITKYDFFARLEYITNTLSASDIILNMLLGLSDLGGRTCEFLEVLSLPARSKKLQASHTH